MERMFFVPFLNTQKCSDYEISPDYVNRYAI